ncbi:SGNH hydrolase domain-containing protein [Nocardioides perillae]|uniref:SGNH domain-containing protein n=1 Tax=Nocardioides perillae TaxID=1119534 RepID=A0A7Y9RSE2_9ACTN|nr:hypothetical protein [Nocardioides perillae]
MGDAAPSPSASTAGSPGEAAAPDTTPEQLAELSLRAATTDARATSPGDAVVEAVKAARRGEPVPADLQPSMRRLDRDLGDLGACDYSTSTRRLCPRGDRDAKRVAVVLGDSHGRFWIPALDAIGARDGWRIYYLVKQQCTAAHVMVAQIGSGKRFTACRDFHRWADRQVERLDPRLVVVSTSAPSGGVWVGGRRVTDAEGVRAEMRRGYQRLVEAVRPDTRRLVLLRDVPRVGFDPQPCLSDSSNDLGDCLQRPGKASEQMNQVPVGVFRQRRLPVVDTRRWVCWDGQCPAVVGNVVTYRDRGHLTASYTATLSGAVGRALRMTG